MILSGLREQVVEKVQQREKVAYLLTTENCFFRK